MAAVLSAYYAHSGSEDKTEVHAGWDASPAAEVQGAI